MTKEAISLVAANYAGWVRPIQVFIMAFVFLFFLRVIRAILIEAKPPIREKKQAKVQAASTTKRQWLYLTVKAPEDAAGERFPLNGPLIIGRSAECDVNLAYDQFASVRHAQITLNSDSITIEDLGSRNGVWVDDERIERPTRVKRGDRIQVGETIFEVTR
jgi:pSer/pThr/pTyr-binding forkhead associated (FHA) protein